MTTTTELLSLGHACQRLAIGMRQLQAAMQSLGIKPKAIIDNVSYLDGEQVEKIRTAISIAEGGQS